MAKVYFGCSMRGGFANVPQETLRDLQGTIKDLGHTLVTEHQTSKTFMHEESKHTPLQIHDRDYSFLLQADIGIFEITNPSLGVGGEISDMIHLQKPVLCLFKRGLEQSVSAYTQGKQGSKYVHTPFSCHAYESQEEAREIIKQFVEANY